MHRHRRFFLKLVFFYLLFISVALPAQSRRAPQPEDLYQLKTVSDPQVSSSGIVFVVTASFEEKQKDFSHLWWLGAGETEPRQLTFGEHSDYQPRFFSDGRRIAFLSDRGDEEKTGLYVLDLRGGEAQPLIKTDRSISDFTLSRDGKLAALILTENAQADTLKKLEKAEDPIKDEDVIVIDRADYVRDGEGIVQGQRQHLWLADLNNGKLRRLTSGEFDAASPVFSADNREVYFHANLKEAGVTYNTDIFSVPADSGNMRQLTTNPAADQYASFSPDGKWLAYLAAERPRCYYDHFRLWIMRPDGTERRCLTSGIDRSVSFEVPQAPLWSADGTKIYVLIEDQASVRLAEIAVSDGRLRLLSEAGRMLHDFDAEGNRAIVVSTDLSRPTELHEIDLQRGTSKPVTHFNEEWLASVQLARIEKFRFASAPGIEVEGWAFFPSSITASNKLPGILRIHGGPQWFYGSDFFLDFHVYAMAGYALFFCNPRGSTTYGAAFSDAIRGEWGNNDYHDLMAATDYVLKTFPQIDSTRLGVMGWSYGGIMTAWLTSHTNRFKAAVCGAPVVDYLADYGETDMHLDAEYEFFGPPWKQAERYRKWSPLTYVANVKTPTLLAHGEEDYRCRITNSERWYISLKRLGVETVFLRYPDAPHVPTRPAHNVHFDRQALNWFNRFLYRPQ
jgi:dipeptidyl aminopeptidase/acylaminoacyl peptidase